MNNQLDQCLWCEGQVAVDGFGGMAPVFQDLRWWHQGCIADMSRRQEGR